MRTIKYFSVIEKKWIDVEVSDEVAKFLAASDMQMKRKQRQYDRYNISLNQPIICDGENLTLEDTIAEPKPDKINKDKRKTLKIIRKHFLDLPKDERNIIFWIYYREHKQKAIAKHLSVTESSLSQKKQTILDNLLYKIASDKEFHKTRLAKKFLNQTKSAIQEEVKNISLQNIFSIALDNVLKFSSEISQISKKLTTLNADVNPEEKKTLLEANRIVKQTAEKLVEGKDEKQHYLNIPIDEFIQRLKEFKDNNNKDIKQIEQQI